LLFKEYEVFTVELTTNIITSKLAQEWLQSKQYYSEKNTTLKQLPCLVQQNKQSIKCNPKTTLQSIKKNECSWSMRLA